MQVFAFLLHQQNELFRLHETLENQLDTTTPMGMLLFNICAAFSEMERELIRERVRVGLDAAKVVGPNQ